MKTKLTNRQRAKVLAAIRKTKREHPRKSLASILKEQGISSASWSVWTRLEKQGVFSRWPNRILNDYDACAKLGMKHPYAKRSYAKRNIKAKAAAPPVMDPKIDPSYQLPVKGRGADLSFEVNVTHRNGRVEMVIDTTPETARRIMAVLAEK